jgi:hypothetical protein
MKGFRGFESPRRLACRSWPRQPPRSGSPSRRARRARGPRRCPRRQHRAIDPRVTFTLTVARRVSPRVKALRGKTKDKFWEAVSHLEHEGCAAGHYRMRAPAVQTPTCAACASTPTGVCTSCSSGPCLRESESQRRRATSRSKLVGSRGCFQRVRVAARWVAPTCSRSQRTSGAAAWSSSRMRAPALGLCSHGPTSWRRATVRLRRRRSSTRG